MHLFKKINELRKTQKKKWTVQELLDFFEEDGIFALIFLLSFPTSIPSPAWGLGFSTFIGGIIILILSFQLIIGAKKATLPSFITKQMIDISFLQTEQFNKIYDFLLDIKKYTRPRFKSVLLARSIIGIFLIPQAILMMIPIPFTNWIPSVIATCISFSYLFGDGLYLLLFLTTSVFTNFAYIYILIFVKNFIHRRFFKKGR